MSDGLGIESGWQFQGSLRYAVGTMKAPEEDPFVLALRNAPRGEPLTPEQIAELEQDMAQLAAGTLEIVAHDDVPAWLEARALEEAALAAE